MANHRLKTALLTGLTVASLAGGAQAATLTATIAPTTSGSSHSPQVHTMTLSVGQLDTDPSGNAKAALVTLVESLPAAFNATLSSFATCSPSVVTASVDKPQCPAASLVGVANATAYVPALITTTNTDQGYIFKIGPNTVRLWAHVAHPAPTGIAIDGTITRGTAPYGPVITWNLKPLSDNTQTAVEVRMNAITTTWQQQAGAGPSTQRGSCQAAARHIKNKRN